MSLDTPVYVCPLTTSPYDLKVKVLCVIALQLVL